MKVHESKTYELRNIKGGCGYAFITLTDFWENAGGISIISDYGNWNYIWSSMGGDIRDFLKRTGTGYLKDKFTYDKREDRDVFDFDKSIIEMKESILKYRKEDEIDAKLAREAWDEADCLSEEGFGTAEAYYRAAMDMDAITEIFNSDYFPVYTSYSHSLVAFMDEVWPEFVKVLEEENVDGNGSD